jgi:hypothetical protein
MPEVVAFIERYAQTMVAPAQKHTQVTSLGRTDASQSAATAESPCHPACT